MGRKNRHLLLITGGFLALFFLPLFIWVCIFYLSRPAYLMPDTTEWRTGDIFFSVGDSWESVAVRALSGAKYFEVADSTPSHCGVVIRDPDRVMLVHESTIAKKIVAETPEEYLKNNGSYCLYVAKPHPALDDAAFRQTVDSLIAKKIPFDFEFNHRDSKSLYCTEMVVRIFELNGNSCFSTLREQSYIYPEDLLKLCVAR